MPSLAASSSKSRAATRRPVAPEPIRELIWELFSASNHLESIRRAWARMLDISGPQWLLVMAIDTLDKGEGVSVGEVSSKLHVNSTFVTAQTKQLEKLGYVKRTGSKTDARVVLLSLTAKAKKAIESFKERREYIHEFIFGEFSPEALQDFLDSLKIIRTKMERAVVLIDSEQR